MARTDRDDLTEDDELTQEATQRAHDPRRKPRENSGLCDEDISDILCILHPCTPAAFSAVMLTAKRSPQHILQRQDVAYSGAGGPVSITEEEETFILGPDGGDGAYFHAQDLALRFSSHTNRPAMGFTFGRNLNNDIIFHIDSMKRISNMHFRIFVNDSGVLMCEDTSTNGTLVDDVHLKAKEMDRATRMINAGSVIQILSPIKKDIIKFVVRIPSRDGHLEDHTAKFQAYMAHCKRAEQKEAATRNMAGPKGGKHRFVFPDATDLAVKTASSVVPSLGGNPFGMKWSGGGEYNIVGLLGKGAFASVYKLATKSTGEFFAAKELEKRRFMKNGVLDQRLQNELQIMQDLRHPHIVQYVDYHDFQHHLYIIMEFVECGDLQTYVDYQGVLEEENARIMSRQVLGALAYLHDKKITHRDIKPDNILIAKIDPFQAKLSDFGLSKVIKNNETFLKTFCGTLLYCAPEVFPHYETYVEGAARGTKRNRRNKNAPLPHAYNQSVDIWSYGAVLWHSLCKQPPFEGVADQTGKAMFMKIMETSLDVTPLKKRGLSDEVVDLLCQMLNVNATLRPSERACLRHPWLADGSIIEEPEVDHSLSAIEELDEMEEGHDPLDLSQLSLHPSEIDEPTSDVEGDHHDSSFDSEMASFDPRNPKRKKALEFNDDEMVVHHREEDVADQSFPLVFDHNDSSLNYTPGQTQGGIKLFGEISRTAAFPPFEESRFSKAPALQSSGALGNGGVPINAIEAGNLSTNQNTERNLSVVQDASQTDPATSGAMPQAEQAQAILEALDQSGYPGGSLLGAESLVRELKMDSPSSHNSPAKSSGLRHESPHTPERQPVAPALRNGLHEDSKSPASENDITPKPAPFSRRIQLNLPVSVTEVPDAPEPQAIEGVQEPLDLTHMDGTELSLPATATGSAIGDLDSTAEQSAPILQSPPDVNDFRSPAPCFGKLTSTSDSFANIHIRIEKPLTNWGRERTNTHVYENGLDTRVPKKAFSLWYHSRGMDHALAKGKDWTTLEDLHTVINTSSRVGIWINGVPLKQSDGKVHFYGRVYTGDEIVVFSSKEERLAFTVELFYGEGRNPRNAGGKRFEVQEAKTDKNERHPQGPEIQQTKHFARTQ